jgi:F0F1-type ATP synthase gamma subunit
MAYLRKIDQEIIEISSLRNLVEIYGEIASVRMIKIRAFVLKNREYLEAISDIFHDTLASYAKKLSDLVKKGKLKKGGEVTFLAHNGKTVAVLISANTGFYGEVVIETFRKFLQDIRKEDLEITIIGRMGRTLLLAEEPKKPYTFFELPDYGVDELKLAEVIKHLVQYEKIRVYFGQYQSVITQKPNTFSISAGTPIREDVEEPKVSYIFEPTVEKILMFFETQIFASLFDQSIRESQLAKLASRILAMDRAAENIKKRLSNLKVDRMQIDHRTMNKKQLNSLSSVVLR